MLSGLFLMPVSDNINPPGIGFILFRPSGTDIKFLELYEKRASILVVPVFLKVYSKAPDGRLELSLSVGMNELQPVSPIATGISSSCNSISAKGNLALNFELRNLGKPNVDPPDPLAESG